MRSCSRRAAFTVAWVFASSLAIFLLVLFLSQDRILAGLLALAPVAINLAAPLLIVVGDEDRITHALNGTGRTEASSQKFGRPGI